MLALEARELVLLLPVEAVQQLHAAAERDLLEHGERVSDQITEVP